MVNVVDTDEMCKMKIMWEMKKMFFFTIKWSCFVGGGLAGRWGAVGGWWLWVVKRWVVMESNLHKMVRYLGYLHN
ncbi:hypothetical protein HanRHA438_Chr15g0687891 [Helianthus annuus]|nr:hypothetical protein HanRHA438_Chr15g0687891 [Helianthus annuus]